MSDADDTIGKNTENTDNTDDIIGAIRRIMAAEDALLTGDPDTQMMSQEAQRRVYAALDRLTGGATQPPTVLEALILEKLEPLMGDWLDRHFPALVERLAREEIRALLTRSQAQSDIAEAQPAET